MDSDFDALSEWLGIATSERPPNHYALLGLELLESDQKQISEAYQRRYQFVRQYEVGAREVVASQVLEELSKAYRILTNFELKQVYDQALSSSLGVAVSGSESGKESSTADRSADLSEQVFEAPCPNTLCRAILRLRQAMAGADGKCKKCGSRLAIGNDLTVKLWSETPSLSEQVTEPRVEVRPAWESMDIEQLNEASERLREELTELVTQGDAKELLDVHLAREFRRQHAGLSSSIDELEHRCEEISRHHQELAGIVDELDRLQDELKQQQRELQSCYEPLGEASYQGLLNGHLRDQPLFIERKASGERIQKLQREYDDLGQATTLLERAKATARQAVIWGKLRIEQSNSRSASATIGRELVETDSIDLVKCDETEGLASKVRQRVEKAAETRRSIDEANSRLDAKRLELQTALGLAEVRSPRQLEQELARCDKELKSESARLSSLNSSLPNLLLEVADDLPPSEDSAFYALLNDLKGVTQAIRDLSP